ncbi:hypothetical protein C8F04DRAFT_1200239 [Mycena alexandri]|uniref:Uncharacterized protein n=1 Tax=Mycena alexandri TaxID=1745969 RepID=A0AAD6WQW2_9AGAR|nr:hypothetical protein C8F04DRAFT_1200239 [Mycena alexandri]
MSEKQTTFFTENSTEKLEFPNQCFLAKLFTDLPELRIQMMVLSNIDFFKDIIYPCSTIPLVAKFVLEFYLSEFGCFTLSRCDRKLGCRGVEGSWKAGVAIYIGVPEQDRAV